MHARLFGATRLVHDSGRFLGLSGSREYRKKHFGQQTKALVTGSNAMASRTVRMSDGMLGEPEAAEVRSTEEGSEARFTMARKPAKMNSQCRKDTPQKRCATVATI